MKMLEIGAAMEEVVLPVLAQLLAEDELIGLKVTWRQAKSVLHLELEAGDENEPDLGFFWIEPARARGSWGDQRARFASELQDFVAESRFGWGEQRPFISS